MKIKKKKMVIILLVIVTLFLSDRCISYIKTTKLKYLNENPESENYIIKQLTTDDMLNMWFNGQDSTCIIKTGRMSFDHESEYLYKDIRYWTVNTDGQLLSVAEGVEEISKIEDLIHSLLLWDCFNKGWYSIEGVSYQMDNPDKSSIRRKGYYRRGLVYRGLLNAPFNPYGSSGNYWGATAFFKMTHNGETIRFKEYATLEGLISFIDASASIKLYCPTSQTKIIWLEDVPVNLSHRSFDEEYKYDRPRKNRGVYVVTKKQ